jgi:leucyl/phenylalanyl-tRNA--protein transferase
LKVSHSLAKKLRRKDYQVTIDQAFEEVIAACAQPRTGDSDTWITPEMAIAYTELHAQGIAHSIESWQEGRLVGGLYGVSIGQIFYGESMFAWRPDASKVAFVHLVRQLEAWGFPLVDCQVHSEHLASLGARTIGRRQFIDILRQGCSCGTPASPWKFDPDLKI